MIEPPETPHHVVEHHRTAIPWFDVAMGVAVLVVSFGSLFVALHTGHTMERLVEQNQRLVGAQSIPILQYTHSNNLDGEPVLNFHIENVGAGPARLVWVRLKHQGRTFNTWGDFINALKPADSPGAAYTTAPVAPAVYPAGRSRGVMIWPRPDDPATRRYWEEVERLRFTTPVEACYCSVFDECWVSDLHGDVPAKVQSCDRPVPVSSPIAH